MCRGLCPLLTRRRAKPLWLTGGRSPPDLPAGTYVPAPCMGGKRNLPETFRAVPRHGSRQGFSRQREKAQEPDRSLNRYRLEKRWIQAPIWFLSFLDSKAEPAPGVMLQHSKNKLPISGALPQYRVKGRKSLAGFQGAEPLGGRDGGGAPWHGFCFCSRTGKFFPALLRFAWEISSQGV